MKKISIFMLLTIIPLSATSQDFINDCKMEIKAKCSDYTWNDEIVKCLIGHMKNVSPGCKSSLLKYYNLFKPINVACGPQIKKICKKTSFQTCLAMNRDEFTGECATVIKNFKK